MNHDPFLTTSYNSPNIGEAPVFQQLAAGNSVKRFLVIQVFVWIKNRFELDFQNRRFSHKSSPCCLYGNLQNIANSF